MSPSMLIYIGIALCVVLLCIISYYVKDFGFIQDNPINFLLEIIGISILPTIIVTIVFTKTRKLTRPEYITLFLMTILQLMVFHLLFQISGSYSAVFETR